MAAAKTPQDRKPKATPDPVVVFDDTPGAELLTPPSEITASAQARLIARMEPVIANVHELEGDGDKARSIKDLDLDALADFIDYVVENFAADRKGLDEFTKGAGAFTKTANLVIAYGNELGKDAA